MCCCPALPIRPECCGLLCLFPRSHTHTHTHPACPARVVQGLIGGNRFVRCLLLRVHAPAAVVRVCLPACLPGFSSRVLCSTLRAATCPTRRHIPLASLQSGSSSGHRSERYVCVWGLLWGLCCPSFNRSNPSTNSNRISESSGWWWRWRPVTYRAVEERAQVNCAGGFAARWKCVEAEYFCFHRSVDVHLAAAVDGRLVGTEGGRACAREPCARFSFANRACTSVFRFEHRSIISPSLPHCCCHSTVRVNLRMHYFFVRAIGTICGKCQHKTWSGGWADRGGLRPVRKKTVNPRECVGGSGFNLFISCPFFCRSPGAAVCVEWLCCAFLKGTRHGEVFSLCWVLCGK